MRDLCSRSLELASHPPLEEQAMRINTSTISYAVGLALLAGSASASPINHDFHIVDDQSYESFKQAVSSAEYVRYDYALDRKPRVVVVAAGLAAYATRNPHATRAQLDAFVADFNSRLFNYADGDPDLGRSTNLLPAMRYATPPAGNTTLDGTNTRVGEDIADILGFGIPGIESYDQILVRMTSFERARVSQFANSPEWHTLLTAGFSGFDLVGNENPNLAGALQAFLETEGYEPVPDGIDDARFVDIDNALSNELPADYAAYQTLLAMTPEQIAVASGFDDQFNIVAGIINTGRMDELTDAVNNQPTLIDAISNAQDPVFMQQLHDDYLEDLTEVAVPRTIIAANAMLLLQSNDPSVQNLAQHAQSFAGAQLQTNDTMASMAAGMNYGTAITGTFFGIATGSPGDVVSGLADIVMSSIELSDTINGTSIPSAEEQIYDQILEMRDQLEDVRVQMNMRFDRIETQLNLIYNAMATGFNQLSESIFDLNLDVQALNTEIMTQRATLERIEDQLWGMANDLFRDDLAGLIDGVVAYRERRGVDLPYDSSETNFSDEIIELFSKATFTASNSTYAGGDGSMLTPMNADALDLQPIGRSINDLRMFPQQYLGFAQPLWPSRVVGPAPWAQASGAYAQIAKESPWYFGYMHATQSNSGLSTTDLDVMIEEGDALRGLAQSARNHTLFDALFDGYETTLEAMDTRIDAIMDAELVSQGLPTDSTIPGEPGVDPWGGLDQRVRAHTANFTELDGQEGLNADFVLPSTGGRTGWEIFAGSKLPELASVFVDADALNAGGVSQKSFEIRVDSNGFFYENDLAMTFRAVLTNTGTGETYRIERRMVWELTSFGSPVQISSDGNAHDRFEQDPVFWFNIVQTLTNEQNLEGTSLNTFNGFGDQITIEFVSDTFTPFSQSQTSSYVQSRLESIQNTIWTSAQDDTVLDDLDSELSGWETLIEAYITLAMPDVLEQSTAVNAALRGNPLTSELALARPIDDWFDSLIDDGDQGQQQSAHDAYMSRADLIASEISDAIDQPLAGHSLLEWTLAELRNLRDNASRFAISDTYVVPAGSISVPFEEGLLANDVDQEYRNILVDIAYEFDGDYVAPQHGTVTVNADGSFSYQADPGFLGTDSFTYRSKSMVTSAGDEAYSEPTTVVLLVTESDGCGEADFTNDGVLDIFDVFAFLDAFNAQDAAADFTDDGVFDVFDVFGFLDLFNQGCP